MWLHEFTLEKLCLCFLCECLKLLTVESCYDFLLQVVFSGSGYEEMGYNSDHDL
ncbi:hypothetical protein KC19_VG009200 [Ceratodon purpureus]|uniref:Uncharacterized protein n=1 Tax=Ceratodon purpureus TaxID=3225 RepID=A0A8T0HKS8_CERPU|nr:hypothetical protein KC19_VG009200 [Ceratodon purpureus]